MLRLLLDQRGGGEANGGGEENEKNGKMVIIGHLGRRKMAERFSSVSNMMSL